MFKWRRRRKLLNRIRRTDERMRHIAECYYRKCPADQCTADGKALLEVMALLRERRILLCDALKASFRS